jgi:hypothetical protein
MRCWSLCTTQHSRLSYCQNPESHLKSHSITQRHQCGCMLPAGVSGGFVDCASSDGMRDAQWRRRFEWSKQLDSLNKQYFGNNSYR